MLLYYQKIKWMGCNNTQRKSRVVSTDKYKPIEMADIRKKGLILQKCPKVIGINIDILEYMLTEHLKYINESTINMEDIPKDYEMQVLLEKISRIRDFPRNFNNMLLFFNQ